LTLFSYHVSHEQFTPSELLERVVQAEAAGFDGAFSSDHFHPWSASQGHSGFTWSWLGAALQATRRLRFAAITVPGGWRYQPTVLAQAIATLGQMFPGRLPWIAVGSGQALNESVVGRGWPDKDQRNLHLREGAEIIQALLAGETVTRHGRVSAVAARLWAPPSQPTRLVGAATCPQTAHWLGSWAEGLLTVGIDPAQLRQIVDAFRAGGGGGKPVYLKADLSWADSEAEALQQAHRHWRFNALGGDVNATLPTPQDFDLATRFVRADDLRSRVWLAHDAARTVDWLAQCSEIGFESIDLHHVGSDQRGFIDTFGESVLPALRR